MRVLMPVLTVLAILSGCSGQRSRVDEKPNFVWIVSEDNSVHYLKLFDETGIGTPNIAALARDGILFTHAFSNAPVCSAARSTLVSACYGPRIGSQFHRKAVTVPMPEGIEMFPAYLRELGYYTTNNFKEDYNIVKSGSVWDESSRRAHWRNRAPGQPFFHMESHNESHEHTLHFDASIQETYKPVVDPDEVFVNPNHPDTDLFRFTSAYYRDKMLVIDTIVGNVVKQLEEDGLLESTFVFYFGDHGGVLPGSKGYLYETGLHVPLVVRVPGKFRNLAGMKPGSECSAFVNFIDFGPTLLALAGAEIPEGIDGKPFLGDGTGEEDLAQRNITYGYADRFDEKYDLVRTVRMGHFKYMRSYQPFNPDALQNNYRYLSPAYHKWRDIYRNGELNTVQRHFFEPRPAEELFDIETDPYETNNLAQNSDYQDIKIELRAVLRNWVGGMPDLGFLPESELVKSAFDNPVNYGQVNHRYINELIDIADLELETFEAAREGIEGALSADDPWKKYWGLIVCSSFGEEAAEFYDRARELTRDGNLLVRTRAAEFLALTGAEDPASVIEEVLIQTEDPVEAALVLNTVVLLKDGPYHYKFDLDRGLFKPQVLEWAEVTRRLSYLLPE